MCVQSKQHRKATQFYAIKRWTKIPRYKSNIFKQIERNTLNKLNKKLKFYQLVLKVTNTQTQELPITLSDTIAIETTVQLKLRSNWNLVTVQLKLRSIYKKWDLSLTNITYSWGISIRIWYCYLPYTTWLFYRLYPC